MKVVLCNCPVDHAEKIAKTLVEKRIAACVNVVPGVKSFYRWEGKLCEDQESTLLIKIAQTDFSILEQAIREMHPYQVPEIVGIDVSHVHLPYLNWVHETTQRESRSENLPC